MDEKKYKEALERARNLYPGVHSHNKAMLEQIFPELRESEDDDEDERIRKEIISLVLKVMGQEKDNLSDDKYDAMLAYLEKQKERGPLTKEEEYILHRIIEYLEDETCPSEWISLLHDIYCLPYEKQKELPFVKDVILGYPGHYFYDGERMHFCGSPAMEETQKEPENTSASTMIPSCWAEEPSLQKEQFIVANDLDEEIKRFFDDCIDVHEAKLYGSISEKVIPVDCYELTARHFAKWGEKQKEPLPIPDKFSGLKSLMLQYLQSAANRKDDTEIESDTDLWGRKILDYVWKYSDEQKEQKEELVYRLNGLMQDYIKEGKDEVEKEHRFKCYQLFWDALEDTSYFEQKEQKPVDANHIVNAILSALSSGLETDEILKARGFTYDDVEEWLNSTRNPAIEYIRGQNKIFENPEKYGLYKPAERSEKHIADIFEKVGLTKIVREQGNDALTNAVQSAMIELSKVGNAEWSEDYRKEDIQTRFAFYTYKDDPSVLYLSNVFVEETSRNHGFGTRILKAAEKVAEAIGAITICLKVKQDSPANAWYRKRGYGYVAFEDGYDWLEKNLEYMKPNHNTLSIEQQMEAAMIAIRGGMPTKSAEWSEDIIRRGVQEVGLTQHQIDWFKTNVFPPKPEWNKEDEEKLVRLLDAIRIGNDYKEMRNWLLQKLKSLRKRPKSSDNWKPSEEQMEALKKVTGNAVDADEYYPALATLYYELKEQF